MPGRDNEALMHVVDEFGALMADSGLPRTSGRVMGWLLVCDPPEQTTSQLVEALHASKASISQATQLLAGVGLITKKHRRGSRELSYEMSPGVWERGFEAKRGLLDDMRNLAEEGLALVGETPLERDRLLEVRDMYAFAADEYGKMLEKWKTTKGDRR
ncbi:MAG: MarR family transcriptional regulator [Actinomycetota bacterium]|nr:MarR family transcriptional regulator [Actinomycetota bacterium]